MTAPAPRPRRLAVAFFTASALHYRWDLAFQDAVELTEARGLDADLLYRQKVGRADLVIVAYRATDHGSEHLRRVLELALAVPPDGRAPRIGIAACERSDNPVTRADIAQLVPPDRVCYPARLASTADVADEVAGWVQVTGRQLGTGEIRTADQDGPNIREPAIEPAKQTRRHRPKWH